MAEILGYSAAVLLLYVGAAHSYLGERYVLSRLLRMALPPLGGSERYMKQILRVAWHVTSVAWWGLAVLVVMLSRPVVYMHAVSAAAGLTALVTAAVVLIGTSGRHVGAWVLFLVVGAMLVWAAMLP